MLLDLHGIPLAATSRAATPAPNASGRSCAPPAPRAPASACRSSTRATTSGSSPSVRRAGSRRSSRSASPNSPASSTGSSPDTRSRLFAIELAKSRAVAETERRLQGDFFDELAAGSLSDADAARGLARFGFTRERAVAAVALEGADVDTLARAAGGSRRPAPAAGSSSRVEATAWRSCCPATRCLSSRSW